MLFLMMIGLSSVCSVSAIGWLFTSPPLSIALGVTAIASFLAMFPVLFVAMLLNPGPKRR